jgi:hypothetical protein
VIPRPETLVELPLLEFPPPPAPIDTEYVPDAIERLVPVITPPAPPPPEIIWLLEPPPPETIK